MHEQPRPTPGACPAYILAGGKNQRFGSDKALCEIAGESMLSRLLRTLNALGHDTHVVADREDRYKQLDLSCLVDSYRDRGPLAGLATALEHRCACQDAGWLLLLSVDQAIWREDWFAPLSQAALGTTDAVVFSQLGEIQPIPGLYHSCLADRVESRLAAKQLSLRNLLSDVSSATITTDDNPRDWSFNTHQDLDRIMRQLSAPPSARETP